MTSLESEVSSKVELCLPGNKESDFNSASCLNAAHDVSRSHFQSKQTDQNATNAKKCHCNASTDNHRPHRVFVVMFSQSAWLNPVLEKVSCSKQRPRHPSLRISPGRSRVGLMKLCNCAGSYLMIEQVCGAEGRFGSECERVGRSGYPVSTLPEAHCSQSIHSLW